MIDWIPLNSIEQIREIGERSKDVPCIIFKHSTRCSISGLIRHRLQNQWDLDNGQIDAYFLDIFQFRHLSDHIAGSYNVRHESPQMLIIRNGACIYDSSHLDITVGNIKEHIRVPIDP